MLPMGLSFRKLLGERFAFSGYFCPLRYAVHVKDISTYRSWLVMFDDSGCRHALIVNLCFHEKHAICHKICIFSI